VEVERAGAAREVGSAGARVAVTGQVVTVEEEMAGASEEAESQSRSCRR
jgi:hypothetical protein